MSSELGTLNFNTEENCIKIFTNQVGYYPNAIKKAIVKSPSSVPLNWELRDYSDVVLATGITNIFGFDKASGDNVHIVDFSSYSTTGTDFSLWIESTKSHYFDIREDIYKQIQWDALSFFYHNRSGIEIKQPYCELQKWERPASHNPDIAHTAPGDWDYTLDLTSGWYDAGDHGKYVVNGGISVWTLLNMYERVLHKNNSNESPFHDGSMNIPENNNGIPDILDEVRYEMEFLLKMQVPQGQPNEGMAHTKINDEKWTGLPCAPHEDMEKRILLWPTTAATLNLAAVAAQCSRLWKQYDNAFADRCLLTAEKAWKAAVENPVILWSKYNDTSGGGGYGDDDVADEFYWAACELYTTTEKDIYLDFIKASPHFLQFIDSDKGNLAFDWGRTGPLGTITLAFASKRISEEYANVVRENIIKAADKYISILSGQGYMVPLNDDTYPWGSNSMIINKAITMAYAYDFTNDRKFLDGIVLCMDYIFGRNPLDQCYVTGYGKRELKNPHHRFFAYQLDNKYPSPPPGILSGGPNSEVLDPIGEDLGLKEVPPQKSFVDNINSYCTNEVAINWNAPFTWILAYLNEKFGV